MTEVKGRTVLISGVSSGIGAALAVEFCRRNDFVVGLSRNRLKLTALSRTLRRDGGRCLMVPCDVRNPPQIESAIRRGRNEAGEFDVVVNNAGVTVFKEFVHTSLLEFEAIVDTVLRGTFLITKKVLPAMIQRKRGSIINVISFAAKTTYTGSAAYSAAKVGVEAMMRVLREEVRGKNIRIINVFPGAVLTPMWSRKHRQSLGGLMIPAEHFAKVVCDAAGQPSSLNIEEIVIRPTVGDLKV